MCVDRICRCLTRHAAAIGGLVLCAALGFGCSKNPDAGKRPAADAGSPGTDSPPKLHKDGQGHVVSATFEKRPNAPEAVVELKKHPMLKEIVFIECGEIDGKRVAPLAQLGRLNRIEFVRCRLTDDAAGELAKLKFLEVLTFGSTPLTAGQFRRLGKCPRLTRLTLKGTSLQQPALSGLEGPASLKELALYGQKIDLRRIAGLRILSQLRSLRFPETRLTDADLAALPRLPQLREFECLTNDISNAGVVHFRKMPELRHLSLANSRITDEELATLQALPKLEVLNLEGCENVTDEGLSHILSCRRLKRLRLLDSGITGGGLQQCAPPSSLVHLSIGENQITSEEAVSISKRLPSCQVVRLRQPPVAGGV